MNPLNHFGICRDVGLNKRSLADKYIDREGAKRYRDELKYCLNSDHKGYIEAPNGKVYCAECKKELID